MTQSAISRSAQQTRLTVKFTAATEIFQTEAVMPATSCCSGQSPTVFNRNFSPVPKEWGILRAYEAQGGLLNLSTPFDWGWFFFLTKTDLLGSCTTSTCYRKIMGNRDHRVDAIDSRLCSSRWRINHMWSMAKMKELQAADGKTKKGAGGRSPELQQGMMELIRGEVKPRRRCLPILMQIRSFFLSLQK